MSILTEIVDYKKRFIETLPEHVAVSVCDNDFMAAFKSFAVIAECKARSPSEGAIVADYHPVDIATIYQQAGASAVSVLTDEQYFGGSFSHLAEISRKITLPLLCKDFIVDKRQVLQARRCGASACLLMMSILTDEQANVLKSVIESLKMIAVIEVFNQAELQRALVLSPQVILINNRNLHDFSVSFDELKNMCDAVPEGIKIIAASGIRVPSDVAKLPRRVDGVLIGTALMKASDRIGFIGELFNVNVKRGSH